jgi:lysophospholipase L1-like esterase
LHSQNKIQTSIFFAVIVMALYACGGGSGGGSEPSTPNVPPVAKAGPSRVVQHGDLVLLDGSASTDEDGQIVAHRWVQTQGSTVDLLNANSPITQFTAPKAATRQNLEFQLTVQDDAGAQSTDELTITVNVEPVADAGPDQFVSLKDSQTVVVELSGSSSDSDGSVVAQRWEQVAGNTALPLSGADTENVSFTAPAATDAYSLRYTVTDNDGAEHSDTVWVNVTRIIFSDSFNDDTGWDFVDDTPISAQWEVVDGELFQTGFLATRDSFKGTTSFHIGAHAVLADPTVGELSAYRFSVDITPLPNINDLSEGNDVGIVFQLQGPDNYYRVSMNAKFGFTRFEKSVGGKFETLAVNSIGYVENQPMTMTTEVNGQAIVVWIDGDPVFATVDPDLPPVGTIALYCQDRVKFDNVLITEPPVQPVVAISAPLAYSVALTTDDIGLPLSAKAVVLNMPVNGQVAFALDNGAFITATELNGVYSAEFVGVPDGEHEVVAALFDADGVEVDLDINATVGTGGDYYVTVGDSITNGMADENPDNNETTDGRIVAIQGYQAPLADLLTASRARPQIVFNEGIEGDKSSDLNKRIGSILGRHPKANKFLMQIGTNDSGGNPVALEVYRTTIEAIVNKIDDVAKKQVWLARMPRTYLKDVTPLTLDDVRNAIILQYNAEIRAIADLNPNDNKRLGPNFYNALSNDNLFADHLHPNDAGYQVMADGWHGILRSP